MELNYKATELETLIYNTIKNNFYIDSKCIKEDKSKRKELPLDKSFAASLSDLDDKLEDYSLKQITTSLDNIFAKENNKFKNLSSEVTYESIIEAPTPYYDIKEYIKEFNIQYSYNIDKYTLQYYKYDENFNKVRDVSDEEYNTKIDAHLCNYNRDIKLYGEVTESGKIIYPFARYIIEGPALKVIQAENLFNAKKNNIKNVMNKIKFNGKTYEENLERMESILEDMFIPDTIKGFTSINYKKLTAIVFMHWLWLVKRNLLDLSTENDMFLILFSAKHGTGKSTFIENLISKVGRINYASKTTAELKDSRESFILSKAILFFDEINQKTANDDMAIIKKKITEKISTTRALYSNTHTDIKRKFSGIAGANGEINEYFGDDNEHRRFFEMRLDNNEGKNHIDEMFKSAENPVFEEIWSLSDENYAEGYVNENSDIWNDLKTIQSTYRNNNTIKTFFDKHTHTYVLDKIMNVDELKTYAKKNSIGLKTASLKTLYTDYKDWCTRNDKKAFFTIDNFGKNLDSMNVCKYDKLKGTNINTGQSRYTTYYYLLEHNDNDESVTSNNTNDKLDNYTKKSTAFKRIMKAETENTSDVWDIEEEL